MSIRGLNNHSGPSDLTSLLYNRDGSARLFLADLAPALDGLVIERSAPALPVELSASQKAGSYAQSRQLVGFSEKAPSQTEKKPFDFAAALDGPDHKPQLVLDLEDLEYAHMSRLRSALSSWDAALCDGCATGGSVLASSTSGRLKLAPHRCQRRDSCPACGRAYSRTRGASAVALMDALLEPGRLLHTEPLTKAWHLVFTNPAELSEDINESVLDGNLEEVRKRTTDMTEGVRFALNAVYGAGVASIVYHHWWHSSNPLAGNHHNHMHVTVPNIRVERVLDELIPSGVLFERGKLEDLDIETLKKSYRDFMLKKRWVKRLGVTKENWGMNVNVSFSTSRDGKNGYKHRLSYDARTAISDLITFTESDFVKEKRKEVACLYSKAEYDTPKKRISKNDKVHLLYVDKDRTAWFLNACAFWQKIQTVRYTGWLVNVQRKKIGLEIIEEEKEESWDKVGFYDLISIEGSFVTIGRTMLNKVGDWSGYEYSESSWHRDHVDIVPAPDAGKKFGWNDKIRPLPAKRGWGLNKGD